MRIDDGAGTHRRTLGAVPQVLAARPRDSVECPRRPSCRARVPQKIRPADDQKRAIKALVRTLAAIDPDVDWAAHCQENRRADPKHTTSTTAAMLIEKLQAELQTRASS